MFDHIGQPPTRAFTKHLSNISLILGRNELKLLYFLIYQSEPDNTIRLSATLLYKFIETYKAARHHYQPLIPHYADIQIPKQLRRLNPVIDSLIQKNILIPTPKFTPKFKQVIINPSITYSLTLIEPAFYRKWTKNSQDITEFINHAEKRKKQERYVILRKRTKVYTKKKKKKRNRQHIDFVRRMDDETFRHYKRGIDSVKGSEGLKTG